MSEPVLETYEGQGFRLAVPERWERLVEPDSTIAFVALEPHNGGLFRANIVVTIDGVADVDRWQQAAGQALTDQLRDYILLDEQNEDAGVRRLFHHLIPESGAVTAEQWARVSGDRGFTLTASAATFDYDAKADLFASIASRFRAE